VADAAPSFTSSPRFRALIGVIILVAIGIGIWRFMVRGRESTDDAQVDGSVTLIAARVGGTIQAMHVVDHQAVQAGEVLVELDPREYQIAVDKARAELADAEASAVAAQNAVPITSTTTASSVVSAQGALDSARAVMSATEKEVDAARARLAAVEAREREARANATKAARDVERLKGLLAKDEISQQQFDAATSAAEATKASSEAGRAQVVEVEAAIRVAESRLAQARASESQATAALKTARTAPEQMAAIRARATSAQAHVDQARASLAQAELNLQHTTVKAPGAGVVARKSANPGQVVQAGQPLLSLVQVSDVWVTANFKETQLAHMQPGQRATVEVDAFGGREFEGKVESISGATGARFSLLPPENATGNFVKVVQRVPVKILLSDHQGDVTLRPGMSVTSTVYTR
jgi:membrane fusion protein, multidrug efflux system